MAKLNSRQRVLYRRIAHTQQQIRDIQRKQQQYHCYSDRTMHYGIRNLHSHIATLMFCMAEV